MYTRVFTAIVHPGKLDELTRGVREVVLTAARQQAGFKNAILLTDAANNKAIYISFWETEADLRASETSGYVREQLAKVLPILTAPPVQEIYEVAVQE